MALGHHKNRNRVNENEDFNPDEWLWTYSDMITLLMAFFLVLIGISEVDVSLYEQFKSGIKKEFTDEVDEAPLQAIKNDLDKILLKERQDSLVSIELGKKGIEMKFASEAFYGSGNADINDNARGIIDKVTSALKKVSNYPFRLDVEGHTDNAPIRTVRFPSNWELSSARATNIVRYMIEEKEMDPNRLKAAGFAATRPVDKNPNVDQSLPENRAKNRRIVIKIY